MRSRRAKHVVMLLSLAAAAGLVVYRRVLPLIVDFAHYSDGRRTFADAQAASIRHAVWEAPEPLAGDVDGPGAESNVALSPDGRWLAFAAGGELFVAALAGERATGARALQGLNSAADEIAPAFGDGCIYFASNRAGGLGGYDLYVADWDGDEASEPTPVAGVNTAADELDPAARGGELYFASDRARDERTDFDLFVLRDDVAALEELNSTGDEREPSLGAQGRALYFASDRAQGFDLYRSFEASGAWLAPHPVEAVNTPQAERSPAPSHDGFALLFVRDAEGEPDLWRARSRELSRVPGGPTGWYDLALIAAFLALALLAWMAQRWEALDILYKCFLASLIVHLLLMLWFRYIHTGGGNYDLPERAGETFRVRLLPSEREQRALTLREGVLETSPSLRAEPEAPERAQIELEAAQAAPSAPAELAATPGELAPAPAPALLVPDRSLVARADDTTLAAPSEAFERATAAAPEVALSTRSSALPRREVDGQLERATTSPPAAEAAFAVPSAGVLVARRADAAALDAPTRFVPSDVGPVATTNGERAEPALLGPRDERVARAAEGPSESGLAARSFATERAPDTSALGAPQRAATELARSDAASTQVTPQSGASAALQPRVAELDAPPPRFEPVTAQPSRSAAGERAGPALSLPSDDLARTEAPQASNGDLPAPLAMRPLREASTAAGDAPSRWPPRELQTRAADEARDAAVTPPPPLAMTAAPDQRVQDLPPAPQRLDSTPYRSRFGPEKEVALREHGGTVETERAVAQGLRYLASRQRRDGSWGSRTRDAKYRDVRVGKTALALLAFLGAGHTPQSATEHSSVAARAVQFLTAAQDAATGHFGDSEAYSHGITTYALAECFAITSDERLRAPLEFALRQVLRHQLTRGDGRRVGGWSYYYPDGATFDSWPRTSITAWQVMALESARLGGLSVPDATFAAAHQFLLRAWDEERGAFRYNHDPERLRSGYPTLPGSTPAALFALALLGEDLTTRRWSDALEFLLSRAPDGFRFDGDDAFVERAQGNLYFWYYGSLALLRHGGEAWERWNAALKDTLLPAQRDDGSWEPIDIYCRYAGDDDGDAIYATAMCVLTLEVYYRYFTPLLKVR